MNTDMVFSHEVTSRYFGVKNISFIDVNLHISVKQNSLRQIKQDHFP